MDAETESSKSQLENQLEQQREQLSVAAKIGQMLLTENESLKTYIAELEESKKPLNSPATTANLAQDLSNEIQSSLLQRLRVLNGRLQDQVNQRLELESQNSSLVDSIDKLELKNRNLLKIKGT